MKILIACEFSGVVRTAFQRQSQDNDVWSCDLLPSIDKSSNHIVGDVLNILEENWDLMIAHPPCTYLARSGMRWLKDQPPLKSGKPVGADRRNLLNEALLFFEKLMNAPIKKIAIENPKSFLIPWKHTQSIQPWQFGHGEVKETCLWLKNLPPLQPTKIVEGRSQKIHRMPPSVNRSLLRSITYKGIAEAMAAQWTPKEKN
jgi:hypothetical protein